MLMILPKILRDLEFVSENDLGLFFVHVKDQILAAGHTLGPNCMQSRLTMSSRVCRLSILLPLNLVQGSLINNYAASAGATPLRSIHKF